MSCGRKQNSCLPYTSLQAFSIDLLQTIRDELIAQQNRIVNTLNLFHPAGRRLLEARTIPDAKAAETECLEHISRLEELLTEFQSALNQMDVNNIVRVFRQAPDCGHVYTDQQIREYVQACCNKFQAWCDLAFQHHDPEKMRQWVCYNVRWAEEDAGVWWDGPILLDELTEEPEELEESDSEFYDDECEEAD